MKKTMLTVYLSILSMVGYSIPQVDLNVNYQARSLKNDASCNNLVSPAAVVNPGIEMGEGGTYLDDEMIIIFTLNRSSTTQGKIKFSIDAQWQKEPLFTMYDSIGLCASNLVMTSNNLRSGYYQYKYGKDGTTKTETVSFSNFTNVSNSSWSGSAVSFKLPSKKGDFHSLKIHYEFYMIIAQPSLPINFQAAATYDHSKLNLSVCPEIVLKNFNIIPSIGLNLSTNIETRKAESVSHFPYIP